MSPESIKARLFAISQSQEILLSHLIFALLAQASLTHYMGARGLYVPANMALFELQSNCIKFLWPALDSADPAQSRLREELLNTLGLDLQLKQYTFEAEPGIAEERMARYLESVAQSQGRSSEELTMAWLEQGLIALFPQTTS